MNPTELLAHALTICHIHVDRLNLAISKVEPLYPFTEGTLQNLNDENLGYLELFTTRLGKLQDTLGDKVFALILECLGESVANKSFIDKLSMLEKLEILPDCTWWQDLRKLRNVITHEYPNNPSLIVSNLNIAFIQAKRLMVFYESLENYR